MAAILERSANERAGGSLPGGAAILDRPLCGGGSHLGWSTNEDVEWQPSWSAQPMSRQGAPSQVGRPSWIGHPMLLVAILSGQCIMVAAILDPPTHAVGGHLGWPTDSGGSHLGTVISRCWQPSWNSQPTMAAIMGPPTHKDGSHLGTANPQ